MSNYWERRITKEENKAQRIAQNYARRNKQYYKSALAEIDNSVNALYAEIMSKGAENITRTELWQFAHWVQVRDTIYQQCKELGVQQLNFVDAALDEVFNEVMGTTLQGAVDASISLTMGQQKDQIMRSTWSGQHYSERIYSNTNALAQNLEKCITDLIILGKTPEQVKQAIMDSMGVSYNVANRLIRTEASHVFNTACIERYKNWGVSQIEILTEVDCCDLCAEFKNKRYNSNNAPHIPLHPNCRCCYIPIIEEE